MPQVRQGVVLLNFGGPSHLEEISDFLYEILRDPHVIHLPFPQFFQNKLARWISEKRTEEVRKQYLHIGGKSPIVEATERQREVLQQTLARDDLPIPVYVAHRYIPGHADQTAQRIVEDRVNSLFLIPLYPHFSWTTSGSSFEQFHNSLRKAGYQGAVQAYRSYPNHPLYLDALSDKIEQTLNRYALTPEDTLILCSAHGVPRSYIDQGDPYLTELLLTMEELRPRFAPWPMKLSFQSKVGPAEWLRPYTDELIRGLEGKGIKSLLFVGISFVNDHLETLFEVDQTYFNLARSVGITPYRAPAIETHAEYINLLCEKTLAWSQGNQGFDVQGLLPPSQDFARKDQWIIKLWLVSFIVALCAAVI